MDSAKPTEDKPADGAPADAGNPTQGAPADALSKTNEELSAEAVADPNNPTPSAEAPVKPKGFKAFLKKVNVYLLGFVLVASVVAATGIVSYLNSKKAPETPSLATQGLSTEALKQLANSDATVGSAAQTLTIQGNAIFSGQVLVRGSLDVAGGIKLGGDFETQDLTVAGTSNLADAQANSLQVANNTALQGTTTMKDLNVAGATAFSGPVTAAQITVTRLILAGNGSLTVPNHLSFSGATPGRSIVDAGTLGAGGTVNINGSDTSGTINVNTGVSPTSGCFVRVNFAQPFVSTPHVVVTPIGQATADLRFYVTRTTNNFSVCSLNAAPGGQVFAFDYFITG